MKLLQTFFLSIILSSSFIAQEIELKPQFPSQQEKTTEISLVILGNVQDAGFPHIACQKDCCTALFENPDKSRKVVSLGILDPLNDKKYLFEATPDITSQLKLFKNYASENSKEVPDGIFLTHAHIGHYTGLMYFGKEAMNASNIPVYAMPKMKVFLESNGPWSQLMVNKNILIHELNHKKELVLSKDLKVIPFLVPHRDEYSETVGYKILGPNKKALFIPDIDKWEKWDTDIIKEIADVDYAFLDATFYDGAEINNRDISEIPHPFIIESMKRFSGLSSEEKNKIYFIHFNHTNPALDPESSQTKIILQKGFHIARINETFQL
ncbi:pyrroloquinoline quinone biosynthesis protein B [Gillisia mitskevichiae]|uniref:Pyrroloquinoline quinone biosynthesis protein B n=1 Tax=Gillisia mitskevichiae TaxID=270921 RepID=A0A495PXL0_9FLAO|nr:MBL fold metallo-hydrolase [Gillisia mitskevichiae]RKS55131.1 pyrroloquinoline quinone biosynthesis protein B [Gillisia mitskevichiae]